MSLGDKAAIVCILIYLLISVCYCFSREWWKAVYYFAALVLNVAVLAMKS